MGESSETALRLKLQVATVHYQMGDAEAAITVQSSVRRAGRRAGHPCCGVETSQSYGVACSLNTFAEFCSHGQWVHSSSAPALILDGESFVTQLRAP